MKHIFKSTIIITLIIFISMIISMSAYAIDEQICASFDNLFNDDYFVKSCESADRTYIYPKYLYNGTLLPDDKIISIVGTNATYDFLLNGGMNKGETDVALISDTSLTVPLCNKPVKYIGVLINGNTTGGKISLKLNYDNDKSIEQSIDITAMNESSAHSYSLKNTLNKGGSALRPSFVEGSEELFLNLSEIKSTEKRKLLSIEFEKGSFDYHIIGITQILYDDSEIESGFDDTINKYFPIYNNKTVYDLTDNDLNSLQELINALKNVSSPNYEKISNLYNCYILYNKQMNLKTKIDEILNEHNYLSKDVTELDDNDVNIMKELIKYYDEAKYVDIQKLSELMDYFQMTDNISIVLENVKTIENLKDSYAIYVEKISLKEKIDILYSEYKDKTADVLTEKDLEKINELLEYYTKAEKIGLEFLNSDKEKIIVLKIEYNKFNLSENDVHYNLLPYYNKSVVSTEGEKTSFDWGFEDGSGSLVGILKENYDFSNKNGIITATRAINYGISDAPPNNPQLPFLKNSTHTFLINPNSSSYEKNIISLKNNETIVLSGSGRMAKSFDILLLIGRSNQSCSVIINFKDGTSYNQSMIFVPWSGYGVESVFNYVKLFNDNGVAEKFAGKENRILTRAYSIPIENGKVIENIVIRNINSSQLAILGVSERVISNDKFIELLKKQWDVVKNYTDSSFELDQLATFADFYYEAQTRGIVLDNFVDIKLAYEFTQKVLTAKCEFSKKDKNTITAKINFNLPVSETELKRSIEIIKNGEPFSKYELTFTPTSAEYNIKDDANGKNSYIINIASDLKLLNYPLISIKKSYSFSYSSPPYLEASYDNNKFTITNNTLTPQKYTAIVYESNYDNSIIYTNYTYNSTLEPLNTEKLNVVSSGKENTKIVSMLWDWEMKPLLTISTPSPTEEKTTINANYNYPDLNFSSNSINISGFTPSCKGNKIITVDISLKGGKSIYKGQILSNIDGYFSFNVKINETIVPNNAYLTIKIGGDDFEKSKVTNDVYFSTVSARKAAIENLSNSASYTDVYNILKSQQNVLFLDEKLCNSIDLYKAADIIFKNKKIFNSENVGVSRNNLIKYLVLAAFMQSKKTTVELEDYFLYENAMEYKNIDKDGVTLYDIFNNDITKEGRNTVINSLLGKNYNNVEELMSEIENSIALYGFVFPNNGGTGYISKLLTQENAKRLEIDITKYLTILDKSKINAKIASSLITSLNDVVDIINNFSEEPSPSTNHGENISYNSGSSFQTSTIKKNTTPTMDIESASAEKSIFKDVSIDNWAYEYIKMLYDKQILLGKGNEYFNPNDYLTRGELMKILCCVKGIEPQSSKLPFTDVNENSWYAPYVATAYNNGLINGISEKIFAPEGFVTRQDFCTILYRIIENKKKCEEVFSDYNNIADYAKEAVSYFANCNILNGFEDNSFRPFENCTRAQSSKIIYMFLKR